MFPRFFLSSSFFHPWQIMMILTTYIPPINLVLLWFLQQFTDDNFNSWRSVMGAALNGKIKIGFIDGSIPKPAEIDPLFCSGMRNKNTISSWLLNSISKEISASVIYVENITEIWKEFHDPFQHKNGPCVYQLKKSILNFTQGSSNVSTYFTTFKSYGKNWGGFIPFINLIMGECNRSLIIFKMSIFSLFS